MCGNGIRLFARYLVDTGLARTGTQAIATRAGLRRVHIPAPRDGQPTPITVNMGRPELPDTESITVTAAGRSWPAVHVEMGNPHAVVFVDDLNHPGDLRTAPTVTPASVYPAGVTVEFVTVIGPRHLALRVHERGVGETQACGTGACAAVAAHLSTGSPMHSDADYTVDSPGGRLHIATHAHGTMALTGPAVIVAQGTVTLACTDCPAVTETRPTPTGREGTGAPSMVSVHP